MLPSHIGCGTGAGRKTSWERTCPSIDRSPAGVTLTLSFGVATYRKDEATDDFVHRADEALYRSKNAGRNKVTGL